MNRYFGRARKGVLLSIASFFLCLGLTWLYREAIFTWLIAPADGVLSPHGGLPVYTGLTEPLGTTLKLMFFAGIAGASPFLTITAFYMVRPALSRRQKRSLALFIPAIYLCFLTGLAFCYYLMLPVSIAFLVSFAEGFAVPVIRVSEYLSLVMSLAIWLGVIFELPLVMFMLVKFRIVEFERFKRVHRFVYPVALIFSAIITPGLDPVASLMLFVPIVVLYQAGLALGWLAQPGKGNLVIRAIKMVAIGTLRRVAVVLVLVPSLLIGLLYVIALSFVFLWDGHLSSDTPSRGKARLDRVYTRLRGMIARVSLLRKGRAQVWLDCYEATRPDQPRA